MAKGELPPPVHILLAYAADGWAAENWQLNPSGRPRHPEAAQWLPVARSLLTKPDGLDRLRGLALAGMAAWGVHASIMDCVVPAFAAPDFAVRLARHLEMPDPTGLEGAQTAEAPVPDIAAGVQPARSPVPARAKASKPKL
jgi:hypothetical protein